MTCSGENCEKASTCARRVGLPVFAGIDNKLCIERGFIYYKESI